jgi:hypothetical protein
VVNVVIQGGLGPGTDIISMHTLSYLRLVVWLFISRLHRLCVFLGVIGEDVTRRWCLADRTSNSDPIICNSI